MTLKNFALAVALLGTIVACGASEAGSDKTFESNVCTNGTYVSPRAPFPGGWDGIALVRTGSNGGSEESLFGDLCSKAADEAACEKSIAPQLNRSSWTSRTYSGCCVKESSTYIVATRGDDVVVVKSNADFTRAFGPVDSPEKAAFLVSLSQGPRTILCKRSNVRKEGSAFEVLTENHDSCAGSFETLYRVTANGSVEMVESVTLEEGLLCA